MSAAIKPDSLQIGDRLDVTLTGVTLEAFGDETLVLRYPDQTLLTVRRDNPAHTYRQCITPVHWPPVVGDVWRDWDGDEHFVISGVGGPVFVDQVGEQRDFEQLLAGHSPLTLAYRRSLGCLTVDEAAAR